MEDSNRANCCLINDEVFQHEEQVPAYSASMKPISFRFEHYAQEDHRPAAIYCARFCETIPSYWNHFATVGSNCVSVYRISPNYKMECIQVFVDEDIDEDFYACSWAMNSTDGTPLLIAAGLRGALKVINCITFILETVLLGHGNPVNDLRTHPVNDDLALSASKDDSIRLWNLQTSVCIAIFGGEKGHVHGVLSIDINPLGNCFLSSGIDNCIKIWNLADALTTDAIAASYAHTPEVSAQRTFMPISQQYPLFSTRGVHRDYVDSCRWVGNFIVSKSTKNRLCVWVPDAGRKGEAPLILREFSIRDCDLWFVRLDVCIPLDLVAIGNKGGKVFVFSLSGVDSHAQLPKTKSKQDVVAEESTLANLININSEIEEFISDANVDKVKILQEMTQGKIVTNEEANEAESDNVTSSSNHNSSGIVELFECSRVQTTKTILSHPKCNCVVRQVTFSPCGDCLVYVCEDGSVWLWSISV